MPVLGAVRGFLFRFLHLTSASHERLGLLHELGLGGRRFELREVGIDARFGEHFCQSRFRSLYRLPLVSSITDTVEDVVNLAKVRLNQSLLRDRDLVEQFPYQFPELQALLLAEE